MTFHKSSRTYTCIQCLAFLAIRDSVIIKPVYHACIVCIEHQWPRISPISFHDILVPTF